MAIGQTRFNQFTYNQMEIVASDLMAVSEALRQSDGQYALKRSLKGCSGSC